MSDHRVPSGARPDVLAFYRELPFNFRASARSHAEAIRASNPLRAYPTLAAVLGKRPRTVDIGCGAGWLANAVAYHHACPVVGIDFNAVAIERARAVAKELKVDARFEVADLFTFRAEERFDLVTSIGVLHHTDDCLGGLRHVVNNLLAPGGRIFIGLYHRYGRRPFMAYFEELRREGASEEAMFSAFQALSRGGDATRTDEVFQRSWFRDQVLHPHETSHTLEELFPILDELGLELEATSINRFERLQAREELSRAERQLEEAGRRALAEKRYFPGFFIVQAIARS
jgi:SAM-dependent methyltransferase